MIKWEDNFIKTDADTWPQVTDQPEIGSEGSHQ